MKILTKGTCPDCGREANITSQGICAFCRQRKTNARNRNNEYIPYILLPEEARRRSESISVGLRKNREEKIVTKPTAIRAKTTPVNKTMENRNIIDGVRILRECGSEIPEDTLKNVFQVLDATDKLKSIFTIITHSTSQQAILDLDQALNVAERKLQHDWEYNGFREEDDIKFKGFLTWRRSIKGNIFFWKKLYSTNTLVELQRAWNAYTSDPTEKVVLHGDRDNLSSRLKRYQITTESISTILNTRRPFTRVFYATNKEEAYKSFVDWLGDRQLHENKSKTTIVELDAEGTNGN
jgi:hypothetical protein